MEPPGEAREATELDAARRRLLDAGADQLARYPWQPSWAPPDDVTLLRFAVRHANAAAGQASHEDIRAALALVETAREDLDTLESALILIARAGAHAAGRAAAVPPGVDASGIRRRRRREGGRER